MYVYIGYMLGCNGTHIRMEHFRYGSFGSVCMCTEQIVPFFQEIQTINAVLTLFDVARQIASVLTAAQRASEHDHPFLFITSFF